MLRNHRSKKIDFCRQVVHLVEIASTNHSSTDDEFIYTLAEQPTQIIKLSKSLTAFVTINLMSNYMMINSGASTNIIDKSAYQQIFKHTTLALTKPTTKALAYGSKTSLPTVGMFFAALESSNHFTLATIYVEKERDGSL